DIDTGIFDPNEGIGGFANAPYEEEAIHPTEVGWTRQSRFKGPENPVIDWTIELPGGLQGFDNAPIIDAEGNIYIRISEPDDDTFGMEGNYDGFYAYDSQGNQLWKRTNFHEEYE